MIERYRFQVYGTEQYVLAVIKEEYESMLFNEITKIQLQQSIGTAPNMFIFMIINEDDEILRFRGKQDICDYLSKQPPEYFNQIFSE